MNPMTGAINKFIVALIGAAVILVNTKYNTGWMLDEAQINSIAAVLTPALVFLIPNRKA
jgi:hypothetical protein